MFLNMIFSQEFSINHYEILISLFDTIHELKFPLKPYLNFFTNVENELISTTKITKKFDSIIMKYQVIPTSH